MNYRNVNVDDSASSQQLECTITAVQKEKTRKPYTTNNTETSKTFPTSDDAANCRGNSWTNFLSPLIEKTVALHIPVVSVFAWGFSDVHVTFYAVSYACKKVRHPHTTTLHLLLAYMRIGRVPEPMHNLLLHSCATVTIVNRLRRRHETKNVLRNIQEMGVTS